MKASRAFAAVALSAAILGTAVPLRAQENAPAHGTPSAAYDDTGLGKTSPPFRCRRPAQTLPPTAYLNLHDGRLDGAAARALDDTFARWANVPAAQRLTIVVHFHGGLVDFSCGYSYGIALRAGYAEAGAEPYFFIYNVGLISSIWKGYRARRLFHLADPSAKAVLLRSPLVRAAARARIGAARDHGDATVREEAFRAGWPAIVGSAGALAWSYMKQTIVDGLDLTDPDVTQTTPLGESCAGPLTPAERDPTPHLRSGSYDPQLAGARTFLCKLEGLIDARASQGGVTNVVLVGHSTGAIYITQLIRKAQRLWTSGAAARQRFDVVFLAPAVSYRTFDRMIAEAGNRVRDLRIFAMHDDVERSDWVLGIFPLGHANPLSWLYKRSLLYAVSGFLESASDEPMLGMDRFIQQATLDALKAHASNCDDVQHIEHVRAWLDNFGGPSTVFVISPTTNAPLPFAADTEHHLDFPLPTLTTMQSVNELTREVACDIAWSHAPLSGSTPRPCPAAP